MPPKFFIKFNDEKFYDAKDFYEKIKDLDCGIHYGGLYDNYCSTGISNYKKTKVFFVETSLPKFFRPLGMKYFIYNGKLYKRGPEQTGSVSERLVPDTTA